jgi:Zn-dependent alcohol dehydrogenase
MRTRAALLRTAGGDWEVSELELDAPRAGEVLVEFAFAGRCHTGEHTRRGNGERLPLSRIELAALVSRRYQLEDINTGFGDLLAGRNARAVIDHSL